MQRMENVKVFSRSINKDLYSAAVSTIKMPFSKVRIKNSTADSYLLALLRSNSDYVINIDEDAFIIDHNAFVSLLNYVIDNDYSNCGMPDGGIIPIRHHNPLVTNPFFNIMHIKELRKTFSVQVLNNYKLNSFDYEKKLPSILRTSNYNYDSFEPYYPFFLWISQNFKVLYLDAIQHRDKISTLLMNQNGIPFLIHTWYSRDYGFNSYHTKRIDDILKEYNIEIPDRKFSSIKRYANRYISKIFQKFCK